MFHASLSFPQYLACPLDMSKLFYMELLHDMYPYSVLSKPLILSKFSGFL